MPRRMAPNLPGGLIRVSAVNSVLALVGLVGIIYQANAGEVSALTVFGTLMWVGLGPGLLIKKPITWRLGRVLIYAYAMGLSLLIVFALLGGAWRKEPLIVLTEVVLVVYLIGIRGYMNSEPMREYYLSRRPGD